MSNKQSCPELNSDLPFHICSSCRLPISGDTMPSLPPVTQSQNLAVTLARIPPLSHWAAARPTQCFQASRKSHPFWVDAAVALGRVQQPASTPVLSSHSPLSTRQSKGSFKISFCLGAPAGLGFSWLRVRLLISAQALISGLWVQAPHWGSKKKKISFCFSYPLLHHKPQQPVAYNKNNFIISYNSVGLLAHFCWFRLCPFPQLQLAGRSARLEDPKQAPSDI